MAAEVLSSLQDLAGLSRLLLGREVGLRFQARGYSMRPTIRDGDIIVVRPAAQVRIGDVVFLQAANGRLLAHRVIDKVVDDGQAFIRTRGDACWQQDPLTPQEQVLGRVVSIEKVEAGKKKTIRLDGVMGYWVGVLWARLPCYRVYSSLSTARRRLLQLFNPSAFLKA